MKIQTTEEVRRFNAQTELVDLVLDYAADRLTDPGALNRLLQLTGHRELGETFQESMRQVIIAGIGWPTGAAGHVQDAAELPSLPPSTTTKSPIQPHEDWCMCHSCCEAEEEAETQRKSAEMRTALKQSRQALGVALWFCHEKDAQGTVKCLCSAALNRINSIIPASEV